jgi:hypothetical protein
MRSIVIAIAISAIASAAAAQQQRSMSQWMSDMKTKYGKTFEQCQSLATARGYRLSDSEIESRPVMMFIEGCLVGKQG